MAPRDRSAENKDLAKYPGLGRYKDGRYYFQNPFTGRQRSLKTLELKQAIGRWALAKALCDKEYGDVAAARLAESLQTSNNPKQKGDTIIMAGYIQHWRENFLEKGKVLIKIKRGQGKPLTPRTQADYIRQAKQLESSPAAKFSLAAPNNLMMIRKLLAPWISRPTHYNHLKAVLGRVYDQAILEGLIDKSPMRDVQKLAVAGREVLMPDDVYTAVTKKLMTHEVMGKEFDGTWRAMACDLFYMLSQQPIDGFSLQLSQLDLQAGQYGEIKLARSKTGVAGIIEMNKEMRHVIDWLIAFRNEQLRISDNVYHHPTTDNLLIYPCYMGRRTKWQPVQHRTFSEWWRQAVKKCGYEGEYWLMDLRKKGLTDEFVQQGENDKGLHETQAMKDHYRLIVPPKRSKNTLTSIRARAK